jgi:hypothetical protein
LKSSLELQGEAGIPRQRSADDYLNDLDAGVRESLTDLQRQEITRLLGAVLSQKSPKLIDLRLTVDLLVSRFYVVLLVGKDRRRHARSRTLTPLTRVANITAAILLLVSLNLLISLGLFTFFYLIKSALGIDLLPGHFSNHVQKLMQ